MYLREDNRGSSDALPWKPEPQVMLFKRCNRS